MKRIQTLADDYPRALKVITVRDQAFCNVRYFLRAVPPEDMLEVKELYTEIIMQFSDAVDPSDQIVERLAVTSFPPDFYLDDPEITKEVEGTFQADSNGLLRINMDLTPFIISKTGDNWIEVKVPDALQSIQNAGIFLLWKYELVHTTEGVRTRQS